jgi:hypothetical protein
VVESLIKFQQDHSYIGGRKKKNKNGVKKEENSDEHNDQNKQQNYNIQVQSIFQKAVSAE